jgi:hypothetical protein
MDQVQPNKLSRLALLWCTSNLTLIYLYDVQMLFERLHFDFGEAFEKYFSPNADIVACPQFGAAIVRCILGVEPLASDKNEHLKCLKLKLWI